MKAASGSVSQGVTSDCTLFESAPSTPYTASPLYIQRAATAIRGRPVLLFDVAGKMDPTDLASVVVSNATLTLNAVDTGAAANIEVRIYDQFTDVSTAVWADGLRDGQAASPIAVWAQSGGPGSKVLSLNADLNAIVQKCVRNHAKIVSVVLKYESDSSGPTNTQAYTGDASSPAPSLTFDWEVPAAGGGGGNGVSAVSRHARVSRVSRN